MILRFAYGRELLIEIGKRLIEELQQLPLPAGFGGFGLSINPSAAPRTHTSGVVSVEYDHPREWRHPEELDDLYLLDEGGEVPSVVIDWFESWRKFDEAAYEVNKQYQEEYPDVYINVGGATFGPQTERIRGCKESDIPDFVNPDQMAGMGGGEFTTGLYEWHGGDPPLEEE